MSAERLVRLLTEIRDQQQRQIENFERALAAQNEYADVRRKGRQTFAFLVYAPWAGLVLLAGYVVLSANL